MSNITSLIKPQVSLNHMYLVVGPEIATALTHSLVFMQEFANVECKVIKTTDRGSWRGIYVRGQNTYIEFFDALNNMPIGSLGLGFGLDNPDDINNLYQIASHHMSDLKIRDFTLEGDKQALFRYVEFPSIGGTKINSFAIQYTEDTFKTNSFQGKQSYKDFEKTDVSRKKYNADSVDPSRLFKDITAIELELDDKTSEGFDSIAEALALEKTQHSHHEKTYIGDDFKLSIYPKKTQRIGVTIHVSLFKPVKYNKIIDIDQKALLIVEGERATFVF